MNGVQVRLIILGCLSVVYPSGATGEEPSAAQPLEQTAEYTSVDVGFQTHDGLDMFGRLILPKTEKPRAIVVYVQTAEGATIDQKRALGHGKTFNYYDLYRAELTKRGIGFFSYEGRGIRMGDTPPKYEAIDRELFNTGTLDNKVKDVLSAMTAIRRQEGLDETPIFLMGGSEGTLIAAEAASRESTVGGLVLYGVLASNMRENFAYILSDGDYLRYRPIDKDNNGSITKEEWESVVKNAGFDQADRNSDQLFTVEDLRVVNKSLLDAIDNEDFDALNAWGKSYAGAALPDKWFEDHFSHADLWSFLKDLKIPVGLFHGDRDNFASLPALRRLEAMAREANLTNLKFHYFEGLDHTLNIGQYFVNGQMPPGHQAIFEYIDGMASKE